MRIEYKPKKKPCKVCKQMHLRVDPMKVWCSPDCGYELAMKRLEVKKKKEGKEQRKKDKETREGLKTLSQYKEDLQIEINTIIRLIDKGHECISSGIRIYVVNAGHLYSIGAYPALRYNLLNIYNQSVHDNKFRGGNELAYKDRLLEIFGELVCGEVEELKSKYPELKLSIPEIKEILPRVRKIVRDLKKQTEDLEKPFSLEQRIEIRKQLNQLIGIYK